MLAKRTARERAERNLSRCVAARTTAEASVSSAVKSAEACRAALTAEWPTEGGAQRMLLERAGLRDSAAAADRMVGAAQSALQACRATEAAARAACEAARAAEQAVERALERRVSLSQLARSRRQDDP